MRGIAIVAAVFALLSFSGVSFASDWDVAGKVLAGIEGARILTGGKIDVIGSVMDIGSGRRDRDEVVYEKRVYVVEQPISRKRVWVPEYAWEKTWVPAHTEYDPRLGKVFIEGHYETYKVESGGHWEYAYSNERDYCSGRMGHR